MNRDDARSPELRYALYNVEYANLLTKIRSLTLCLCGCGSFYVLLSFVVQTPNNPESLRKILSLCMYI